LYLAMARFYAPVRFKADHLLEFRPTRHTHEWEVTFVFKGPIADNGVIINLLDVKKALDPLVQKLEGTFLNGHPEILSAPEPVCAAARVPTCENLARYFYWYLVAGDHALEFPEHVTLEQVHVQLEELGRPANGERGYAIVDVTDFLPELLRRRHLQVARLG